MSTSAPTLPRETRDTLLILAAVALVLLPQVSHLPLWTSALAGVLLAWRLWMARAGHSLPGKWLLAALLLLAIGATVLQFRSIVGPQAGGVLVVLLLVLKTLEMRARRDAMVIFFLGFFTLLTLFLESQSLSMAVAIVLATWGLLTALVNAHMPAGYPRLRQLLRTSGLLMLMGAPLMLVLFVVFPRLPPLWGLPTQTSTGSTGLSSDMTVGQVASLAKNQSVALRVRFDSASGIAPPQRLLYFRGPVLSHFDGRTWLARNEGQAQPMSPQAQVAGLGPAIPYEITLEAHQQRWLLTLDATLSAPQQALRRLVQSDELQWLSYRPINDVLRYQGQAHLHYTYDKQLSTVRRQPYLQLPTHLNPRTQAWAQALRQTHGSDDMALVQAVLQRLGDGSYRYTLSPGVVSSAHTADAFWFDQRDGFCEHIASAFAVVLRAAGIPTRIVTGYQGGERNAVDGLWTVRQSDAHAWTEVWLPGEGWLRIDPTAAVAPARTEQLQRLELPSTVLGGAMQRVVGTSTLLRLRANWEALNHRWNDWVLGYTSSQQSDVLRNLGLDQWSPAKAAAWLGAIAAAIASAVALQRWQRWRRQDPWLRLLQRARAALQARGVDVHASSDPRALAAAAQAQWGQEALPLQHWLLQMEQWRYAPQRADIPSLATLRRHFRALTWPRPRNL